jgi:hypothetical protein
MSDIKGGPAPETWIIIGWFTPDYRHWAERLAKSLAPRGVAYHLLAKEKPAAGWGAATRRKPDIALEALALYPGKTVVLLDVDAEAIGALDGLGDIAGDVSAFLKAKTNRKGVTTLMLSTRVLALRPTPATTRLLEAWREACKGTELIDEAVLGALWPSLRGITLDPLPERFAARERDAAPPDAALVHDSARDVSVGAMNPRKYLKRLIAKRRQPAG